MKTKLFSYFCLLSLLLASGCQKDVGVTEAPLLNGLRFVPIVDKNAKGETILFIKKNESQLVEEVHGVGRITFASPMPGGNAASNRFKFEFLLDALKEGQEKNELVLSAYAQSGHATGAAITIGLNAEGLYGRVETSLDKLDVPKEVFEGLNPEEKNTLHVEIDNSDARTKFLIWTGEPTEFTEATALFVSEDKPEGRGESVYWGFSFLNAHLYSVERELLFEIYQP